MATTTIQGMFIPGTKGADESYWNSNGELVVVASKVCCCKGCKEDSCREADTCGCPEDSTCSGETACDEGKCDDGVTSCSCCEAGYAKTSADPDAECEFLKDECPTECTGIDCTSGWAACGCEEKSIECTAWEGDGSGYEPGQKYTQIRSAQENTRCVQGTDRPTGTKGLVAGQTRKSCCGECKTAIWCPEKPPDGGGGGGGGGGGEPECNPGEISDGTTCYTDCYELNVAYNAGWLDESWHGECNPTYSLTQKDPETGDPLMTGECCSYYSYTQFGYYDPFGMPNSTCRWTCSFNTCKNLNGTIISESGGCSWNTNVY